MSMRIGAPHLPKKTYWTFPFRWRNAKGLFLGPRPGSGLLTYEEVETRIVFSSDEGVVTNELAGTRYRR